MPANYHHHIQSIGALRVVRCSSMLYGECSAHHGAVYLNGEQPKSRWIVRENNFNCSNWLCRFLRKRKKKKEKTEKFPFIGVARSGQRIACQRASNTNWHSLIPLAALTSESQNEHTRAQRTHFLLCDRVQLAKNVTKRGSTNRGIRQRHLAGIHTVADDANVTKQSVTVDFHAFTIP